MDSRTGAVFESFPCVARTVFFLEHVQYRCYRYAVPVRSTFVQKFLRHGPPIVQAGLIDGGGHIVQFSGSYSHKTLGVLGFWSALAEFRMNLLPLLHHFFAVLLRFRGYLLVG